MNAYFLIKQFFFVNVAVVHCYKKVGKKCKTQQQNKKGIHKSNFNEFCFLIKVNI